MMAVYGSLATRFGNTPTWWRKNATSYDYKVAVLMNKLESGKEIVAPVSIEKLAKQDVEGKAAREEAFNKMKGK